VSSGNGALCAALPLRFGRHGFASLDLLEGWGAMGDSCAFSALPT
jgi:hypothetical protein